MRSLALPLARILNAVCSTRSARMILRLPALGDRSSAEAFLEWEYGSTPAHLALFAPHHRIEGRDVLDVGCGLGGKSVWMALHGARSVTAVDTDGGRLGRAGSFARERSADLVELAAADAAALPFPAGTFDLVLFNDSFEHLADPEGALKEAVRVLRPGGRLLVIFPPYGSPWGAHLFGRIAVPWAHLILPEEAVLKLWREYDTNSREATSPGMGRESRAASRIRDLFHLNGMTVGGFLEMVEQTGLETVMTRLDAVVWMPALLARRRALREHFVRRVVAVLQRPGG